MKTKTFILAAACMLLLAAGAQIYGQNRIRFARGRTSATVSGTVGANGTRRYVLSAARGQQLSGNVSSRNGCVKFTEGSTSMSFTTDRGDNRISVTNYCRNTTSFVLTVSINY
jgi:hypothetical protein